MGVQVGKGKQFRMDSNTNDAAGDFLAMRFEVNLQRIAASWGDVAGGVFAEVHGGQFNAPSG